MRDGSSRRNRLARGLTMVGVVGAMVVGFLPLGLGVTAAGAATATGGQYVPMTPVRIASTVTGSGLPNAGQTMPAGGSITVALPSSVAGASAVALNVTATNTTGSGFFTVYPAGGTLPLASSLNYAPSANVPNFVIVPVGANNSITIYNGPPGGNGSTGGAADAIVDLEGSFLTVANTSGGAGHFNPLTPARITDTRAGSGKPNAGSTLTPGGILTVQATGQGLVPAVGVSAVEVNVTEAANTAGGFLTVFPSGNTPPVVSNLNFFSGQIIANRVIVQVSPTGQFNIFNHAGNTDVVVDVDGYFTDSTGASGAGSLFNPLTTPARVIDTRSSSPIGPNTDLNVPITGIPAGSSAAVLNVTEASNTAGGFLTVSPTAPHPLASDVNFVPGVIVANGDIAALSSAGSVNVYNHDGNTNVVLDVAGSFTAATPAPPSQTITVTPGTTTTKALPATPSYTSTVSVISYSASGLPSSGTASIHLFPCTATGAPTTTGSTTTFTAPGGTTPVAGQAVGDGSTDRGPAGTATQVNVTSVNGAPITSTTKVDNITPNNGTVTFTTNSTSADCAIPVVFADTSTNTTGGVSQFLVSAAGVPSEAFGTGGASAFIPAEAAPGGFGWAAVSSVNKAGSYFTAGGSTYYYGPSDAYQLYFPAGGTATVPAGGACTPTSQATFLSALTAGDGISGTYARPLGGTSTFCVNAISPAAPSNVTATAQTGSPTIKVTFGDSTTANVASYNVYREQITAGNCLTFAPGSSNPFTMLASVTDTDPTTANAGTTYSYSDTTTVAAGKYCYAVTSVSSSGTEGPAAQSPASGSAAVTANAVSAATPLSVAQSVTDGTNVGNAAGLLDTSDVIQIQYNAPVVVASNATIKVADLDGTVADITNGVNGTFTVGGTNGNVLTIVMTAPAIVDNIGTVPGVDFGTAATSVLTVQSEAGISNANGQWNLPSSGVTANGVRILSGKNSTVTTDAGMRVLDGALVGNPSVANSNVTLSATDGTAAVDTINTTTAATAGTYTLTFNLQTTVAIPWNANASTIQTDLQALSTIGAGNIGVGGAGTSVIGNTVMTFAGNMLNSPENPITMTPTLTTWVGTIAQTTPGVYGVDMTAGDTVTAYNDATGGQLGTTTVPAQLGPNGLVISTGTLTAGQLVDVVGFGQLNIQRATLTLQGTAA